MTRPWQWSTRQPNTAGFSVLASGITCNLVTSHVDYQNSLSTAKDKFMASARMRKINYPEFLRDKIRKEALIMREF